MTLWGGACKGNACIWYIIQTEQMALRLALLAISSGWRLPAGHTSETIHVYLADLEKERAGPAHRSGAGSH